MTKTTNTVLKHIWILQLHCCARFPLFCDVFPLFAYYFIKMTIMNKLVVYLLLLCSRRLTFFSLFSGFTSGFPKIWRKSRNQQKNVNLRWDTSNKSNSKFVHNCHFNEIIRKSKGKNYKTAEILRSSRVEESKYNLKQFY